MNPSVYVSVVLKAARVLEQLATLVAGVAAGATAVQSLLHAVREVLRQCERFVNLGNFDSLLKQTCPLEETGWRGPTMVRR